MGRRPIPTCPEELQQLITVTNSIRTADIHPLISKTNEYIGRYLEMEQALRERNADTTLLFKTRASIVVACEKLVPKEVQEYIGPEDLEIYGYDPLIFRARLFDLFIERMFLISIIEAFGNWKNSPNKSGNYDVSFLSPHAIVKWLGFAGEPIRFGFNSDTTLRVTQTKAVTLLQKYSLPVERLRQCVNKPKCENVFWAKRLKTKYCDRPQCEAAYSKRKERRAALVEDALHLRSTLETTTSDRAAAPLLADLKNLEEKIQRLDQRL